MSEIKDKLLGLKSKVPSETVSIPGVGEVEVRGLTAAKRDKWEMETFSNKGNTVRNIRASLVSLCLYHDGAPLLGPADVDALGELPAGLVDHLYDIASRVSGLGVKDREVLEGNSESAR